MGDTVLIDSSLTALALLAAVILAAYLQKTKAVAVNKFALALMGFGCFWPLFNWITHLIAVSLVNVKRLEAGSFTYSFQLYSLLLMGLIFAGMSALVLYYFLQMNNGRTRAMLKVKALSCAIILLSLPIVPLNPIGLLPVISSVIILATIAATRKQWITPRVREFVSVEPPVVA